MNREDIIRMAREAGLDVGDVENESTFEVTTEIFCRDHDYYQDNPEIGYLVQTHDLLRFAALVAAAEREACAKVCEAYTDNDGGTFIDHEGHGYACAAAIRARGQA